MVTRIWITRTQPGADRSADAWAEAGFQPVIAPLLNVSPVQTDAIIPAEAELIFTSAQGVRHSGLSGDGRRVYTVGDATARVARDQGFTNVISAGGDWQDLLSIIPPTRAPLIHLSGQVVRGRLVESLRERGLNALRITVYQTQPVTSWPLDVATVQAVALYSPLATQTLMQLPVRLLSHLRAYCLSPAVAEGLVGPDIRIAPQPNELALIACSSASDP